VTGFKEGLTGREAAPQKTFTSLSLSFFLMAYISQEEKKKLAPGIKAVLKRYKMKGTLSINNYSTLVCTLKSGSIDFGKLNNETYEDVNVYHIDRFYEGKAQEFLNALLLAMKGPDWFDKSDLMTDYHHVAHYCDITIGSYKKPYLAPA